MDQVEVECCLMGLHEIGWFKVKLVIFFEGLRNRRNQKWVGKYGRGYEFEDIVILDPKVAEKYAQQSSLESAM